MDRVKNGIEKYGDILDLPHHISSNHPQMSIQNRAAQFAPFAALTGYEEAIKETERLTDKRIELSENQKEMLDGKLQILKEHTSHYPEIEIVYFAEDQRKEGGSYERIKGSVKKIDFYEQQVIMDAGERIRMVDIYDLRGDLFSSLEDCLE